jgi:hypothetical protein
MALTGMNVVAMIVFALGYRGLPASKPAHQVSGW